MDTIYPVHISAAVKLTYIVIPVTKNLKYVEKFLL